MGLILDAKEGWVLDRYRCRDGESGHIFHFTPWELTGAFDQTY